MLDNSIGLQIPDHQNGFDDSRTLAQQYFDKGAATFSIYAFAPFLSGIRNDISHRTLLVVLLVTTAAGGIISQAIRQPNIARV
jgi:hypothetical protein